MLMRAGARVACNDIEHLRVQPGLFGMVPPDSTLCGTFRRLHAGPPHRTLGMAAPAIHTNPKSPSTVAREHAMPASRRNGHLTKDQG